MGVGGVTYRLSVGEIESIFLFIYVFVGQATLQYAPKMSDIISFLEL